MSSRYLLPVAAVLASDYNIMVPDLPGHGLSSKAPNALPVVEQAEIVAAWLRELKVEKAVVLANSYGCEIVVELAIRHPDLVHRLILTGPTADPSAPTKFQQAIRLFADGFVEKSNMLAVLLRDMRHLGWHRAMQTTQYMIEYDYYPRLPLVKTKTLVARGGKDPLAPQKWVEEMVSLLPDAQLAVIPDGPHNINFTTPEELGLLVRNFLA
ncbi:MAG: alpha/beta hydrolase [Leptolyngbya sp.]|nr:alpha/beta hydrolase [Candidatus Melainabacteria bacterium]